MVRLQTVARGLRGFGGGSWAFWGVFWVLNVIPLMTFRGSWVPFLAALGLSLETAFGERLPFNDVRQKYKIHSSEAQ